MDDELPRRKDYPTSPAGMSKTPSWIMLGFILGALFVAALPPLRKPTPPAELPRRVEMSKPIAPRQAQPLSTIEAVFDAWSSYAVWSDDTTEVALWNAEYRDFSDFYEVRRVGLVYYFRSLTALTRPIFMPTNLPPDSPLRFTETEERRRDRLVRGETGDLRRAFEGPPPTPAPNLERPIVAPPPRIVEPRPETGK